ncbi:hypothetical protein Hdeb2414_s0019g00551431 [Helianthus debilis subsp. tardiflorus]
MCATQPHEPLLNPTSPSPLNTPRETQLTRRHCLHVPCPLLPMIRPSLLRVVI